MVTISLSDQSMQVAFYWNVNERFVAVPSGNEDITMLAKLGLV